MEAKLEPRYEIDIFWSDEDEGYIANVPALKYCSAFGETYEEALEEVRVAIDLHLEVLRETGRTIPDPDAVLPEGIRPPPKGEAPQAPGQPSEVNEAAQKFTEALAESYQTVIDRAVSAHTSAQTLNAELTQNFFNSVINNLRAQAESNRQMTEELQGQQERQREATQALTQESVGAYMDFVNSIFSFYRKSLEEPEEAGTGSRQ